MTTSICNHKVITMRAAIIKIGNSKGIRIPKSILEECQIGEEVDLRVEDNNIILVPLQAKSREGWAEKFQEMAEAGEDRLLIPEEIISDFKDWEW